MPKKSEHESEDFDILDEIPTGPQGQMAPGSMPTGVNKSLTSQGVGAEPLKGGARSEEEIRAEVAAEQEELAEKTAAYVERQWADQRKANLRSGLITKKDSRIYRQEIKRDMDGDILTDEENLQRMEAIKTISPRPRGWLPGNLQKIRQRLPEFLQRILVGK